MGYSIKWPNIFPQTNKPAEIKKKSEESNGKLTESTPKKMILIPEIKFTKLFINGQFVDSISSSYKVGMIEQVETSEQAKSRGASSIIQRKLVQVVTPSTNLDGNIGPDVVHLLSITELHSSTYRR
ncbi:hypothetical protein POM88_006744 [Heracleum sosnowskyi]|uniref:DNA mismatch repair protein MutS-like N-terminal domain-containing protein n=1 Tax=Heracleum sosnowskyi TaxID=360622 RepID=A0AAD8J620_9APIA|nr:hypothetical protein POM88_006744 [Heracleum sosnowskyi]